METYNVCEGGGQDWHTGYGANRFSQIISAKDAWAGPSPERAFSEDTPWAFKRQAEIKYYAMLERDRKAFDRRLGRESDRNGRQRVQPQISAFYTSFPWPARASSGHTVFLEASDISKEVYRLLNAHLDRPETVRARGLSKAGYARAAHHIALALANRALFDMLGQSAELGNVAFYRLFQAAHDSLAFRRR